MITLKEARNSISKSVIYKKGTPQEEAGIITSVNELFVFVRYSLYGDTSQATSPEDLDFQ